MKEKAKIAVAAGLRRIEGQVRGVQRMLDEERYCIDVLGQMKAIRVALHRLEATVLRDHVAGCVAEAFSSGGAEAREEKIDELVETIGRITR